METMKEVTRYECQYCKKDFKTPNRHECKFNPVLKNCFTCKYLKCWDDGEDYSEGYDYNREPNFPNCVAGVDGWDIENIKQCGYNMQCDKWEEGKYDWSKESD